MSVENLKREYLKLLYDDPNVRALVSISPAVYEPIILAAADGLARQQLILEAKMVECKIIPFPCDAAVK